jgi:hypothetical protein
VQGNGKESHRGRPKNVTLLKCFRFADPIVFVICGPELFVDLKVHKIENFFGSEFEFYTISLLVMLKY